MMPIATSDEIVMRMTSHQVNAEGQVKIDQLRANAIAFGQIAAALVPYGREGAMMLTKLEESLMWGVKAIAAEHAIPVA